MIEVNKKNYDNLIGNYIVFFHKDNCPSCKRMEPIIEHIARNNSIKLYGYDTDKDIQKAIDLKVQTLPTLIFYKDKEEVDRLVGYQSEASIEEKIKKIKEIIC